MSKVKKILVGSSLLPLLFLLGLSVLGGYHSPFGYLGNSLGVAWLIPIEQMFWFTIKGITLVILQMVLRWTLQRLRVDQLMTVCWKYLIPYSIAILLIVGFITVL